MPDWGTFQHLNTATGFPITTRGSTDGLADIVYTAATAHPDGRRALHVAMTESMDGFEVLCAYLARSCHRHGDKKRGAAPCPAHSFELLNGVCPFAGQDCSMVRFTTWMTCIVDIAEDDKRKYVAESIQEADNPKTADTKSSDDGASSMDKLSVLF